MSFLHTSQQFGHTDFLSAFSVFQTLSTTEIVTYSTSLCVPFSLQYLSPISVSILFMANFFTHFWVHS